MPAHPHHPRGYVLMVVIVLGIVLASLASILLTSAARDRIEAKQQAASVRALYASEAAVSVGVEHLRSLLEQNTAPSPAELTSVENDTRTSTMSAMNGVTFPVVSVRYYDPIRNIVSDTPTSSSNDLVTITSGPNRGLRAQQTPIQVLASARVNNATASVADAIRVDLIPVFQFAIFFDGDLEFQRPATMNVSGRVHTNGNLYLSNGNRVNFLSTVTSAKKVHTHSAVATSLKVGSGTSGTYFTRFPSSALVAIANNLPLADAAQRTYLETTYGLQGGLQDITTGVEPLSIPLRMSSSQTCVTNSSCGTGRSCMKVRVTDPAGVCTNNVISRPDKCSDSTTAADFAQSLAVELIKRPARDYANNATAAAYHMLFDRTTSITPGAALSGPYTADFGPRPALTGAVAASDIWQERVLRRVPHLNSTPADDDPGAVVDRMYWKAHIRIVDGIWYRKGSSTPIFDPERDAPGTATPVPNDLNHAFARVLRYAWWWDARENRVYCEASASVNVNCVDDGNEYQRGAQIRATDFDAAAFMALLSRADARARLFPDGTIPSGGIIVYLSETYDPKYEDANSKLDRAANVRNLLNFPVTHNHVNATQIAANSSATPCAAAACGALAGLQRQPTVASATNSTTPTPLSAHEVGWFPENLWGQQAGASFESMTRPPTGTDAARAAFYANPPPAGSKNASACAVPGTDYAASRRPASRPTLAALATPSFTPPCLQVGAQPLGPENAVRVIRAQTLPAEGFTFVSDNRLYIHGDVNVRRDSSVVSGTFATNQDIGGKYSFIADSVTIQSEVFDERSRQAHPGAANSNFQGFHRPPTAWTASQSWSAAAAGPRLPYSAAASAAGSAANVCKVVANNLAVETRINASLLMGDVPACPNGGDALGSPSGGVNNFPRFVENWTGADLVINGSMVGLFRAERGNARFLSAQTNAAGTVRQTTSGAPYPETVAANICDYRPPNRKWTFDQVLLTGIDRLPPGTPRVVANDRLRWVRR